MDAEGASLVACRSNNAARLTMTHGHRLSPKLRIVALLDRGIEGIHVDVDDLAHASRAKLWLSGGSPSSSVASTIRLGFRVHAGKACLAAVAVNANQAVAAHRRDSAQS